MSEPCNHATHIEGCERCKETTEFFRLQDKRSQQFFEECGMTDTTSAQDRKEELKRCPFCDVHAVECERGWYFHHKGGCFMSSHHGSTLVEANDLWQWNTRAPSAKQAGEAEPAGWISAHGELAAHIGQCLCIVDGVRQTVIYRRLAGVWQWFDSSEEVWVKCAAKWAPSSYWPLPATEADERIFAAMGAAYPPAAQVQEDFDIADMNLAISLLRHQDFIVQADPLQAWLKSEGTYKAAYEYLRSTVREYDAEITRLNSQVQDTPAMAVKMRDWMFLNRRGAYDQDGKYIGFVIEQGALEAMITRGGI